MLSNNLRGTKPRARKGKRRSASLATCGRCERRHITEQMPVPTDMSSDPPSHHHSRPRSLTGFRTPSPFFASTPSRMLNGPPLAIAVAKSTNVAGIALHRPLTRAAASAQRTSTRLSTMNGVVVARPLWRVGYSTVWLARDREYVLQNLEPHLMNS